MTAVDGAQLKLVGGLRRVRPGDRASGRRQSLSWADHNGDADPGSLGWSSSHGHTYAVRDRPAAGRPRQSDAIPAGASVLTLVRIRRSRLGVEPTVARIREDNAVCPVRI